MSSSSVIALDHITKIFQIQEAGRRLQWHGLGRRRRATFTAVDDVSFSVRPGELVGLVGANGAGKSTVLKILSRVMHPTKGTVTVSGPIMSLLEVGAAFHPELTARENVYLTGAILGVDRSSIKSSFDAIVALAGVERFLETPVKRFSSGMRVRLAVSVGLHLESDAVVLDEVLSVGDTDFQRRCLEALDESAARGQRATLVVSHNMQTIQHLCKRVLVMHKGQLIFDGAPDRAIAEYYRQVATGSAVASGLIARTNAHGSGRLVVSSARLVDEKGESLVPVEGGPLGIEVALDLRNVPQPVTLALRFVARNGQLLASAEQIVESADDLTRSDGRIMVKWLAPVMPLAPAHYAMTVSVSGPNGDVLDVVEGLTFSVADVTNTAGTMAAGMAPPHVVLTGDWAVQTEASQDHTVTAP